MRLCTLGGRLHLWLALFAYPALRWGRGVSTTLLFNFPGQPPRRTLQAGRGAFVAGGKVRFFTRQPARMEAAEMRAGFAAQLPPGWTPSPLPATVEVALIYPARKSDRLADDELHPHTTRPDVDNLTKSILDAATRAGVWADDGQVYRLAVSKWRGTVPRWAVRVEFEDPPPPRAPCQRRAPSGGQQTIIPGF